jgi:hypothetical protein
LTPQAQEAAATDRKFRLALGAIDGYVQRGAGGLGRLEIRSGDIASRAETPPRYITMAINRNDGPEDSSLGERCLTGGLPEFGGNIGSFGRIVQTPGGISMFYDVGQGQGSPHLQANIRQWYGDSRGHWEGDTLVVDVTNYTPKTDVFRSRENLRLVERWTRTGPTTRAHEVMIEDPTAWTRPWTVKQEFSRQSDEENRLYTEPRSIERNQGLPGLLHGRRVEDLAFARGRSPAIHDEFCIDRSSRGPVGAVTPSCPVPEIIRAGCEVSGAEIHRRCRTSEETHREQRVLVRVSH